MSDIFYFQKCPKCKTEKTIEEWEPDLCGYVGDTTTCSNCKTVFKIVIDLKEVKHAKS